VTVVPPPVTLPSLTLQAPAPAPRATHVATGPVVFAPSARLTTARASCRLRPAPLFWCEKSVERHRQSIVSMSRTRLSPRRHAYCDACAHAVPRTAGLGTGSVAWPREAVLRRLEAVRVTARGAPRGQLGTARQPMRRPGKYLQIETDRAVISACFGRDRRPALNVAHDLGRAKSLSTRGSGHIAFRGVNRYRTHVYPAKRLSTPKVSRPVLD